MECLKCSAVVGTSYDPIICSGSCGFIFHRRCITPTLNKPAVKLINENRNVVYMCDICLDQSAGLVHMDTDATKSNDLLAQTLRDFEANVSVWISSALERGIETLKTELCAQVELKLETTLRETLSAIEASKLSKAALRATSDTPQTSKTVQDVNLETWAAVTKKRKMTNSGDSNVQTIINRFDEGNNKVTPKIKKINDVKEPMGKNK